MVFRATSFFAVFRLRFPPFLAASFGLRGAGKGNGHPSDSAAIVNLGSINSYVTYPPATGLSDGFNPYPHGKGAVLQISKDMGVQLASENIRVNAVCPLPETRPETLQPRHSVAALFSF